MTTEVTKSGREMIRDLLVKNESEFGRALQNNIDPAQFTRIALTMIQSNPKLLQCGLGSLYSALMQAAQLSLNLDGLLGQAYLVPYADKAVMIIGYKGLRELALRTNKYRDVRARVVYMNDPFKISLGSEEFIEHEPFEGDRGEKRACYAIAELMDGSTILAFMWKEQINKHKEQYSKAWKKSDSIWQTAEEVAWEKTLIRRLCGRLQMSVKAQHAMALEDRMDAGLEIPKNDLEGIIDIEPEEDTDKGKKKPNLKEALGQDSQPGSEEEYERNSICSEIDKYLIEKCPKDSQAQEAEWNRLATIVMGHGRFTYEGLSLPELKLFLNLINEEKKKNETDK